MNLPGLVVPVLLVGAWELLVRIDVLTFTYLPPPSDIVAAVGGLVTDDDLAGRVVHTTAIALLAWAVALAVALAIGTAIGLSPKTWRLSMASIEVMRTLPAVALVPVVLLVLGPTVRAEIVVAAYAACWPMLISVASGLQGAPPRLIDVARQMRLSKTRVVFSLMLPAAAPLILSGARLALGISLIVVVLAEMVGNPQGLGAGIVEMQMALQPESMWVYVLCVALLGTALNAALLLTARLSFSNLLVKDRP
ncbi:ABC transporter permease [Actinocorallia sp. A-T 12471]|uniref:ABC transporter permease n=1 Tax=Actinocorallia sp. A-T 12471 TaxID=3089813 RepID=UPI0029CE1F90|nr:ABC transporter permease subunit [Actinocorallia sp. A-T 12471]MDX6744182.1 ABC transporter permease subunit [Actinocorallia sp. A-T 12471]